ncbi:hypothetical protein RM550_11795 [Streptomyces sp. DSM 41527]|uniref:Uncharacterized protein n=1 Tax=Streptomyces mooreae TaxID=3075523 RepID=A0ABU2T7X8_9ACTN|nr:hypothetical protein [Streptomyces sp. DSM 41527]MDT0456420.1 hypothetical protein [Streptomyces sp. DSM 41527]
MIFIANDSTRHDIRVAREHRRSIGLVRYHFDTAHVAPEAIASVAGQPIGARGRSSSPGRGVGGLGQSAGQSGIGL